MIQNLFRQTTIVLWHIMFMTPTMKMMVFLNLLWDEFLETNATFRSDSTDLNHALVVCDLTQILKSGSSHIQPVRDQHL